MSNDNNLMVSALASMVLSIILLLLIYVNIINLKKSGMDDPALYSKTKGSGELAAIPERNIIRTDNENITTPSNIRDPSRYVETLEFQITKQEAFVKLLNEDLNNSKKSMDKEMSNIRANINKLNNDLRMIKQRCNIAPIEQRLSAEENKLSNMTAIINEKQTKVNEATKQLQMLKSR